MIRGNTKRNAKSAPWSIPRRKLSYKITESNNPKKYTMEKAQTSLNVKQRSPLYLPVICFVTAVIGAAFVFHLHVRFEGVRLGYETSAARAATTRLLAEQRELNLELASLKAPERVETEARERLDMEVPDHSQIVLLGKRNKSLVASGGAR